MKNPFARWFKRKLQEEAAAAGFVDLCWRLGPDYGSSLCDAMEQLGLKKYAQENLQKESLDGLIPHYVLANIAVELQAVGNLFPAQQGARIRALVIRRLEEGLGGAEIRDEVLAYEREWQSALAYLPQRLPGSHLSNPLEAVAERAVAQWLQTDSPDFVLAIPMTRFLGIATIWKDFRNDYRITPT